MTWSTWIGVGLLGGAGAAARLLVTGAADRRARSRLPVGTLSVNLLATFAAGVVAGAAVAGSARTLLLAGLLGAFSTFSTWMLDTHRLAAEGRRGLAAVNIVASVAGGLLAIWAGERLGCAL